MKDNRKIANRIVDKLVEDGVMGESRATTLFLETVIEALDDDPEFREVDEGWETDAAYRLRLLDEEERFNDLDRYAVSRVTGNGLDEIGRHYVIPRRKAAEAPKVQETRPPSLFDGMGVSYHWLEHERASLSIAAWDALQSCPGWDCINETGRVSAAEMYQRGWRYKAVAVPPDQDAGQRLMEDTIRALGQDRDRAEARARELEERLALVRNICGA